MQEIRLKLEAYINKYLELWDFYGVIQVTKKGEVLFENAYGYASIKFGVKNDPNSCFSIASMSKQFTAQTDIPMEEITLVSVLICRIFSMKIFVLSFFPIMKL
ncbi:serine hydrolase [Bacillus sp. NPDC094106]|uniref:serine hydrolase n=1 Tax=Bacillus sp. NPDC094106 TaxID=3363949 RepID=UPI00381E75A1